MNDRRTSIQVPEDAVLLRIFLDEDDRWHHTEIRGPMGFGRASRLRTAKIPRMSKDLPLVIEIVDSEANIDAFLPASEEIMGSGLVTLEDVKVLGYGAPA